MCWKIKWYKDCPCIRANNINFAIVAYQHSIMILYTSFGAPGGGGRRQPSLTLLIAYIYACRYYTRYNIIIFFYSYINIGQLLKWFMAEAPYLIHDTTKAPHITGSRVFLVVYGLQSGIQNSFENQLQKRFIFVERIIMFIILLVLYTSGAVHFTGTFPPWETQVSSTTLRDIPKSLIYVN